MPTHPYNPLVEGSAHMLIRKGAYANVASTLALVVALGGVSYAAVAIPKNSVGSKQIINSSVKSADVKNGTLKGADFKAGELPAAAQGPAGPAGPAGAAGPAGPVGPSNGYSVDAGNFLSFTGAAQTVSTLNVPVGSYVVFAKVLGNNNDGAEATMNCDLKAGAATVDAGSDFLELAPNQVAGDRQYMPLSGSITVAAPTALTIECTASTALGNWVSRGITAVKVGALG